MSKKPAPKANEPVYVTRTVRLPLSESELRARERELPLVISQEGRLAMRRKNLLADLKAEAEDLTQKKNNLVEEINTGERKEDLRCLKMPVLETRQWHVIHPTTGEVIERFEMGWEEYERLRNAAREAEAEATAETQLDLPLGEGTNLRGEAKAVDEVIEGEGVVVGEGEPTPSEEAESGADAPGYLSDKFDASWDRAYSDFFAAAKDSKLWPVKDNLDTRQGIEQVANFLLTGVASDRPKVSASRFLLALEALTDYQEFLEQPAQERGEWRGAERLWAEGKPVKSSGHTGSPLGELFPAAQSVMELADDMVGRLV